MAADAYVHSPVHHAVVSCDHAALKQILSSLPRLCDPSQIRTEQDCLVEEAKADSIAATVDRRDVPGRETPLHVAVRLADPVSVELLMFAGANWHLINEQGWSAIEEAIWAREENLAKIIVRHGHSLAWAKRCRRLPRILAAMKRMRDFYMEITFHFESSVIPFISRIAPSDTYKIWKHGSNLRADLTLAGFDGFRIQRADQSVLFIGDRSEDGKILPGSVYMLFHKNKEVLKVVEGKGRQPSEADIQHEVSEMLKQANFYRPHIDVTQAELIPQLTWRGQERKDMVGPWKARVYDMHNVIFSLKSRRVAGVTTDETLSTSCNNNEMDASYDELMTPEERKQLELALKMGSSEELPDVSSSSSSSSLDTKNDRKRWYGGRGKKGNGGGPTKQDGKKRAMAPKNSVSTSENGHQQKGGEHKIGLHPVLWMSRNFPLQIEELLPLLDILANKVKAIRRLRDLLTTKLPPGTFPVKVAIPVVPTIRVIVTFTKFEELEQSKEFVTPPSSPESKIPSASTQSSSWFQWMKTPSSQSTSCSSTADDIEDLFLIPSDYTWTTGEARKKRAQENKSKVKKGTQ